MARSWRLEATALARLLYYAVTVARGASGRGVGSVRNSPTLLPNTKGQPTAGQEYAASWIQDARGQQPRLARRALYAAVMALAPYVGGKILIALSRALEALGIEWLLGAAI